VIRRGPHGSAAARFGRVTVRKSGAAGRSWEARCSDHPRPRSDVGEELYFTDAGAVAFNTAGIGNRTWELAMEAVAGHLSAFHAMDAPSGGAR
jgi:hypothetical protein